MPVVELTPCCLVDSMERHTYHLPHEDNDQSVGDDLRDKMKEIGTVALQHNVRPRRLQ